MSRFLTYLIISVATILGAVAPGCGSSLDKEKPEAKASGGMDLKLIWPEGYRYDSKTSRLTLPGGKKNKSAPAYVTRITLTVFGEPGGSFDTDIPLNRLTTLLTLTPGERRLALKVETNLRGGATVFTGELVVNITLNMTGALTFTLAINAPPVIHNISLSSYNPAKHELVTATADVTDEDPGDKVTLNWTARNDSGEVDTFTGTPMSGIPDIGGRYTLTLVADDGAGGVTRESVNFFVINHAPVIREFVAIPNSATGEIDLYCNATDADDDRLNYILAGPNGWRAEGQRGVYQGFCGEFACVVDDFDDGVTERRKIIGSAPPVVTSVTSSATFAKPGDSLSLACNATDPENDPLTYFWPFTPLIGSNINYTFDGQNTTLECVAEDTCFGRGKGDVLINNGQNPSPGTTCAGNFNNGVVRLSIAWNTSADLDLTVTDPAGTKTWYGHLRPGNGSELCVDVACNAVGGSVTELVYFPAGSTPATASTFMVDVTYANDCGAGPTTYNISFAANGNGSTGYRFSGVTGSTVCGTGFPYSNCTDTSVAISPGVTQSYTFRLQNP